MSNNTVGSPGTLLPIVGPGGRLPIGPSNRNAGSGIGPALAGSRVSAPQAAGMWPVPLSAAINADAQGYPPAQTSAPMSPASTFPG
jgi:hypothetical protein